MRWQVPSRCGGLEARDRADARQHGRPDGVAAGQRHLRDDQDPRAAAPGAWLPVRAARRRTWPEVRTTPRIEPLPGQESVWDYPRPPRLERSTRRVRVTHAGIVVADSVRTMRVLETSHPPSW